MSKFHVTPTQRVMPCNAREGNCPFGKDTPHFDSIEEAEAYVKNNKSIYDNKKIIRDAIFGESFFPTFSSIGSISKTKYTLQRGDFEGFKNVYRVEVYYDKEKNPQDYVAYFDSDGNVEDFTINKGIFSEIEDIVCDISDAIIKILQKGERVTLDPEDKEEAQKETNAKVVTYNDLMEINHKINEIDAKVDILIEKVDTLVKLQKP